MSIRANINLIDRTGEILLYAHQDGNPEKIVPFLKPSLKNSKASAEEAAQHLIKEAECHAASYMHEDIEYYYNVIVEPGQIYVYGHDWSEGENVLISEQTIAKDEDEGSDSK